MLNGLTLRYHYEGAYVASSCTRLRVEILAVGRDEARQYERLAGASAHETAGERIDDFVSPGELDLRLAGFAMNGLSTHTKKTQENPTHSRSVRNLTGRLLAISRPSRKAGST
jgi:hypothetical protein